MHKVRKFTDADEVIYGEYHLEPYQVGSLPFLRLVGSDDWILAEGGDDTVYAGGGDDFVEGGEGDDVLYGEEGHDTLKGGTGNDTLYAGLDTGYTPTGWYNPGDTLQGGLGNDVIYGSNGNDVIGSIKYDLQGHWDSDTIWGGGGDDFIIPGYTGGEVYGGDDDDHVNGSNSTGSLLLEGEAGNDTLIGGSGSDRLLGGADADELHLSGGTDVILGGEGNDIVYRSDDATWDQDYQSQSILGGAGYDTLDLTLATAALELRQSYSQGLGIREFEHIIAGSGDDTVGRFLNFEILEVGAGNDIVEASSLFSRSYDGGTGTDTLDLSDFSGVAVDTGPGLVQHLLTSSGTTAQVQGFEIYALTLSADRFTGSSADETVRMGEADDTARGGAGDDVLQGEKGDDFLNGGLGDDTLLGGADADTFHFDIDKTFGHDLIADFDSDDQIVLDAGFAGFAAAQVTEIDGDVMITVLGQPDSSIYILGAAGLLTEENLLAAGEIEMIDVGF